MVVVNQTGSRLRGVTPDPEKGVGDQNRAPAPLLTVKEDPCVGTVIECSSGEMHSSRPSPGLLPETAAPHRSVSDARRAEDRSLYSQVHREPDLGNGAT